MKKQKSFKLKSKYKVAGDQFSAISSLVDGLKKKKRMQILHGATGTGKTFVMANIIQKINKPTLVIAHNKTLAAQLASEFKTFFPENAVHYFVSYYDYYQPEAYVVATDTFIEKDLQINKEIDMLRHASTQSLLTRNDVIIVASVSAIYGLGSPSEYKKVFKMVSIKDTFKRTVFIKELLRIFYERTTADLEPGKFRLIGNVFEIMPVNEETFYYRIEILGRRIVKILIIDAITRQILEEIENFFLFPAKHFITSKEGHEKATKDIEVELKKQVKKFKKEEKFLEAQRLERRTNYDLAMIREIGYCSGIENYSRHFSGKKEGEAPDTLLEYFKQGLDGEECEFITFVDESHITIPQIGGMYGADASRKKNLIDHGFRLPSAKDNRPLRFDEFEKRIKQMICVSATPGKYEIEHSQNTVDLIIRPTGLLDPIVEVCPILENKEQGYKGQVYDFVQQAQKTISEGGRVLATTLTKRMAEILSEFLKDKGIKSVYLHSEVDTLDRIKIISDFRKGKYDILVGVNLLREGLDMPEVELIGILDADKEGFLRSETALIQTIGRAARNEKGRVILYADKVTKSMKKAIDETNRRRKIQEDYNKKHNITPKTIKKNINDIQQDLQSKHEMAVNAILKVEKEKYDKAPEKFIKEKRKKMEEAVERLDFETAALIRDEIKFLAKKQKTSK